jgi:hypothetical protein
LAALPHCAGLRSVLATPTTLAQFVHEVVLPTIAEPATR